MDSSQLLRPALRTSSREGYRRYPTDLPAAVAEPNGGVAISNRLPRGAGKT